MSEKSELKPCAHCGCAKVIIIDREVARHIDHELFLLEIRCTDCTANIQCYGSKLGDSLAESIRRVREHLIAAWNRRASPEPDLTVGPEPAPSDRERAGFWATKDCPACGGRGETYPLCPSCADSTEDHECPDPVKCKVCDERGEIVDTQLRDRLAAEFAAVRREATEIAARRADALEAHYRGKIDDTMTGQAKHRITCIADGIHEAATAIRKGEP